MSQDGRYFAFYSSSIPEGGYGQGDFVVAYDLQTNTVSLPTGAQVSFSIERFARYCLLNGTDELGFLLQKADAISQFV